MKEFLSRLFFYECSPHKLAAACSLAIYVAFCPFTGLHTLMLIGSGWIFRLNVPLLISVGYIVNNPFTMIPILMSGYFLGHWILHSLVGVVLAGSNPVWMESINHFLHLHLGLSEISFWAFMLGGNVLGILLGILLYPLFYTVFLYLSAQQRVSL